MDRPNLPLNVLRAFDVAARQGIFTQAAIELRVSQAAVSHQIKGLEDLLGVQLFTRTPKSLLLTDVRFSEVDRLGAVDVQDSQIT